MCFGNCDDVVFLSPVFCVQRCENPQIEMTSVPVLFHKSSIDSTPGSLWLIPAKSYVSKQAE